MSETCDTQLTAEVEIPSNSGESDENSRRLLLKRVTKIVSALALIAGGVISLSVEEDIVHYDPDLAVTASPSIFPRTLPSPVKAMEQNVLAVDESIDLSRIQVSASGIQLNNNTLLTAGHFLRAGNGSMFPNATWCDAFTGISPRGFFRGISQSSTFSNNSSLDVAVLKTKPIGKIDGSIHPVTFSEGNYIGEQLYFINFQTTPEGDLRPPSTAASPAIYGGVAESYDQDGDINVPTVVGYGFDHDHDARLASSGGPVFNDAGELVGIVVQIRTPGPTVRNFSSVLGDLGLEKLDGNTQYTDAVVEPVTPEMIADFEATQLPYNCKS